MAAGCFVVPDRGAHLWLSLEYGTLGLFSLRRECEALIVGI